jgi:hypothetical protein
LCRPAQRGETWPAIAEVDAIRPELFDQVGWASPSKSPTRHAVWLAECLSDFLPGSGAQAWKGHVTFGTVATRVGVGEFWSGVGSKSPRIAQLLEGTLHHRRERFEPLILGIVREGLLYRRRNGRPIAPGEIEKINGLILEIGFRFPDLWDEGFQAALSTDDVSRARSNVPEVHREAEARTTEMMILQSAIELPEFLRRRRRLLAEEGLIVAPFDRVLGSK